ncbi:MAG: gliding motility-associated C-terminal domain-containing protein [Chitinophagales bacterium]|nr:gliding motility-associated C-terminal domain-containing protein [Chitinophagales bacterium]
MRLKVYYSIASLLIFLSLLLLSQNAEASHAMGADLQYECLGNNNYRITLRFYRDCKGIAAPSAVQVTVSAPGCAGASSQNVTLNMNTSVNCPPGSQGGCEVSQLCPSQLSQSACNWTGTGTAPYPGVQVYVYSAIVNLPVACSNWRVRFAECCRNNAINNVVNPSGNDLSIEAIINNTIDPNTGQSYCNNSVAFSSLPVPFVCVGSNVTYNNGAVDVDGDSVVYNLINPLGNAFNPMNFNAGWSVTNPVKTTPINSFQFNNTNGQMEFVPAGQEVDVLAMRIEEYRNGVLVGSTMRDIQVTVLNCAISIPVQQPISNVQNGNQVDSLNVQACPNTPLQFDILCTDPANHNLTLSSNITGTPSALPGATLTQIGTGSSVVARINWTPQPSDTGCHNFILIAKNDDCPINGSYTRVYTICIFNKVQLLSASPTFCGTPVQLTATGGTNYTWSPATGPNAVSNPNTLHPVVTPVSPTMYYFTSDCGTDSVFVNAAPPFQYDAGLGGTICQNGQLQLNATTDNLYNPYTYKWVPSAGLYHPVTGLPNDTIPNPIASPLSTTKYKLYVTGNNGCTNVDSLTVTVSGTGPVIVAKATPANVCPNDPVQLNIFTSPQSCGVSQTPCGGNVLQGQIGTGTGSTPPGSPTQYPTVYGHYSNSARHQFLFRASELLAQFPSGGEIRSLSFYLSQINTANDTMKNFEIKMGCTSATELNTWQTNLSTVFSPKTVPVGTTLGWKTHTLDFPYNWDGVSNLVIDICFNNPTGSTLNNKMQMTPTTFNSVYFSKGGSSQCGITGVPSTSVNRPNIQLSMCVEDVSTLPISWTPATGPNAPVPTNTVNPVAHPVTPVIYHVDVTAPNSCVSSDYVFVNVDTSLRFYAFPNDTFFCSATPVKLTTTTIGNPLPGQSFSYQWTNLTTNTTAGTGNSITVTPTTTTSYLVTLSGGACTLRDTVHVNVGTNLPVNLTVSQITCNGAANGKVKAVPVGGNPPLSFTWSNAVTGVDSIMNLLPGSYSVTVSDAQGCSGTASTTLTQPAVLTVSASVQNITCNGQNNGSITLTVNGGTTPYSYAWNPAQLNLPNISGLAPANYNVVITDANGCTVSNSSTVTQPSALNISTLSYNATSNGGNEGWSYVVASGGTVPYTYTWSTGSNNDTIENLYAGTYYVTVCDANGCCKQDTAIVTDPPPIILSFTTINNLCFGDCSGTAQVSAVGGIEPYTFVWSNGTNGNTASGLCAGIYIVTATDSAGISVTGNLSISQPPQLVIALDTTPISCFGANNASVQAIVSGGVGGYTYNWAPGGNTNPINSLSPGNYSVVVTDANNCTAQNMWMVTEPPQLTAVISTTTDVSCFGGSDGSATVVAAGGTPNYTYYWSGIGTAGATAAGFQAGSLGVTVTDSRGCTATTSFALSQPAAIVLSVTTVAASCHGMSDGSADLTVSGGTSPYTYQWTGGYNTQNLTGVPAAVYTVTVTDSKTCTATSSATINQPTAIVLSITHTDPLCTGTSDGSATVSATGGAGGYTYDWAYTSSTNDNALLSGIPSGTYNVTVADATACTVQGNVTLTDPPSLTAQLINKVEITCANAANGAIEVAVTGGTPPIQYNWSHNATTPVLTNVAPGNYSVTVADVNGCNVVLNTTFTAPPAISLALFDVDSASCPNYTDGAIQLSAIGGTPNIDFGYEYSLNGSSFQQSEFFDNLAAGVYQIQVRDGAGCVLDTTALVVEPTTLILSVLPTDTVIPLGTSITLVSSIQNYLSADVNSYTWVPGTGVVCTDCPQTIVAPYTHTTYTLTVNYLRNCSVSETVRVYVGDGDDFFVPNAFSPNGDGNNDVFEIYGTGLAAVYLKIFNRWGEKIFDSGNQWQGWDGTYKGVLQNPGVYTYHAEGVYLNGKVKAKTGTVTILR